MLAEITPEFGSILLAVAFGLAALLYSSVGHGGASAYLAVMGLAGMAASEMKPTALVLNIAVSGLAFVVFFRAGHFRSKLFFSLALASVPAAFLGGAIQAPAALFKPLLCLTLMIAGLRLLLSEKAEILPSREASVAVLVLVGMVLGFLSGLLGVGGGIFLTPLLIFMRWSTTREAAAISAAFIFANSASGLAGLLSQGGVIPASTWAYLPGAILGGFLGSFWGGRRAVSSQLRKALAVVLFVAVVKFVL